MSNSQGVVLRRIEQQLVQVSITGVTPLIVNNFSEKSRTQMENAQQGNKGRAREPKNPKELFEAAHYRFPDGGHGIKATAFKSAIVSAGRFFNGFTMVQVRQSLFVRGEGPDQLVRLEIESEPIMRTDAVRNSGGGADLRYRPMYEKWGATLSIAFIPGVLAAESLLALIDAAGIGGVGEWRASAPKSNGDYGRFALSGVVEVNK